MFKPDFSWGVASAAYQIEGSPETDGKGLSVWDMMCRKTGAVHQGHTGNVACDHVNRFREDVALMKQIGAKAYRFSISWPRVLPEGTGKVNEKGLAFYDRLVDELLKSGIQPWATLFHWDFPYALYCRGGWLSPDSPKWFADYTAVVADKLSDRVKNWMTLNEPQCFIDLGHRVGIHAPGLKLADMDVFQAMHHTLLAHGRAVQTLRARCKSPASIGWAPVGITKYPVTESKVDIEAARTSMFDYDQRNAWSLSYISDPVIFGKYPDNAAALQGADAPRIGQDDFSIISQKLDFFGVNIYEGHPVKAGPDGKPLAVVRPEGYPITAFGWPVEPLALYWGPRFIAERYKLPVVITENGLANLDWVDVDGNVNDTTRIDFTRRYLRELRRASADGVDVRGYFHWCAMDNFEWAEGYSKRFGLIHVDFATQKRTIKASGHWYRNVIESNGRTL